MAKINQNSHTITRALKPNRAIQRAYYSRLKKIVERMTAQAERETKKLFPQSITDINACKLDIHNAKSKLDEFYKDLYRRTKSNNHDCVNLRFCAELANENNPTLINYLTDAKSPVIQSFAYIENAQEDWTRAIDTPQLYNKMLDDTNNYIGFIIIAALGAAFFRSGEASREDEEQYKKTLKKKSKRKSAGRKLAEQALKKTSKALLQSVPQKYFETLSIIIGQALSTGVPYSEISPQIEKLNEQTERRIKRIAEDQTRKAHTILTAKYLQSLGMNKFMWIHTNRSKVPRPYHKARHPKGLNRGIFSFDDPPVIDLNTKERGLPGQTYNCQCQIGLVPVL